MTSAFNSSLEERHFSPRLNNYDPSTAHVHSYHNDSGEYWCDTCDKGFRTAFQLENHKKAHQKCNIDGCQFIAHPNVITRHIQMQHSTGLYKKICKLNDPEEIKKWREERKKKYPTKQNIEKKTAQIQAKVARGEKMGIYDKFNKKPYKSDHGPIKNSRLPFKNSRNSTFHKRMENKRNSERSTFKTEKQWKIILPPTEVTRTLKPFGGIQHLIIENDDVENESDIVSNSLIEEDEYVSDTPNALEDDEKGSKNNVCGALSSLMCNYGSSDEEENCSIPDNKRNPIENKNYRKIEIKPTLEKSKINITKLNGQNDVKEIKENQPLNFINNSPPNEIDDDSGPEETKIVREQVDTKQNNVNEQTNKTIEKQSSKPKLLTNFKSKLVHRNNVNRRKLPSTLLEKLLHREIQKERNIVLQCIRYIIKNNYFDTSEDLKLD